MSDGQPTSSLCEHRLSKSTDSAVDVSALHGTVSGARSARIRLGTPLVLFRYTCHQCGRSYYPRAGPGTPCPKCFAEPNPAGAQVIAWFAVTGALLFGVAYLIFVRGS